MKVNVIIPTIRRLYGLLSPRHKVLWGLLIAVTVGYSLLETIGISAIMPFISIASNPLILDTGYYKKAFDLFGMQQKETFIIYFGIGIIIFYVLRSVYIVAHTYLINRFSMVINKHFSSRLFGRILSMPYYLYIQKNSGELTGLVNSESRQISNLSLSIMQLYTEVFTIFLIYALMLVVNIQMTLILTVVLVILGIIFINILVYKNRVLGKKRVETNIKTFRVLREAMGNYKFVRLKGNKDDLISGFTTAMHESTRTQVVSHTLNIVPKSVLESLGFSLLIGVVIYILAKYHDASMVIPTISMYALALYRILPSMHRLLGNINTIAFNQHTLNRIDEAMHWEAEKEGKDPISFNETISLNNVSFKYATGGEVINNVSLVISKGEKIAITGESGGGKSTLVDLIIGIHKPVSGEIVIDRKPLSGENIRAWRSKIGYIPQSIYLFDGTVAENVTYGSTGGEEKIKVALQKANIWDFLSTKDGIHTKVGEGGIQLSGGQQQRIGIARALYDDPEVLVLDEATSALDNETEQKIMDEIYSASKSKTLIVIAHRLSTVQRCERHISFENGSIIRDKK